MKTTTTAGKFTITVIADNTVVATGTSKQCEICARDYQTWCLKSKAPKLMQAAYDAAGKPADPKSIFSVAITALDATEFAKATTPAPKTITPKYTKLLELLAAEIVAHPEIAVIVRSAITNMVAAK